MIMLTVLGATSSFSGGFFSSRASGEVVFTVGTLRLMALLRCNSVKGRHPEVRSFGERLQAPILMIAMLPSKEDKGTSLRDYKEGRSCSSDAAETSDSVWARTAETWLRRQHLVRCWSVAATQQ